MVNYSPKQNNRIIIATRESPMAMWQAEYIKQRLRILHKGLHIEILGMTTLGDQLQSKPLAEIGGKSLFVKELQQALLNRHADMAVHCIKDMSVHDVPGLTLAAIHERSDPRDVLVSRNHMGLNELPVNAMIGTSSPRRASILKAHYPHLMIKNLRGNVNTRLEKLDNGEYDAIILAAAGLQRLDMEDRISEYLSPKVFIPAIGQGALGIEVCNNNTFAKELIAPLHDETTAICIHAERAVNRRLGGNCYAPIGAHAVILQGKLHLQALVGNLQGNLIEDSITGDLTNARALGTTLAEQLLTQGAAKFLEQKDNV